ncbi:hypothetical protein [Polaribacter sp.]|uniref:hypothetical protein n=1 Tax=Polaribacter sp. TaxID=1920175 RepID=UPI003F6D3C16
MNIQKKKLALINEILAIEKPDILLELKKVLETFSFNAEEVNEKSLDYDNLKSSQENRKLTFINDFINLENKETIAKLEKTLFENNDFWNALSTSEKEEINLGIKQLDEGKRHSYESVLKEIS